MSLIQNVHNAVMQVDSPDHETGQIGELQKGYMLKDRLRPSMVRICS